MCLFNRLSLKNSSTDAWTTKTNTSFLEFVYGFTAVQLKARDLHTVRYCRSPIVNAVVGKRFLYLLSKSWSGVYLFGGVRYNYGYSAKVFIMDDTGLWLPYPQDLQAWLWSILKRFWLACYMYAACIFWAAWSQNDFSIEHYLLVIILFISVAMKVIRSLRFGNSRWGNLSISSYDKSLLSSLN